MNNFQNFDNFQNGVKLHGKRSAVALAGVALAAIFFAACSGLQLPKQLSSAPQTSPIAATPAPTTADIRTLIDTGAQARESGDYQTGEQKLQAAFDAAIALKDKALGIEAGNNLSIQFRLSAGRASRASQLDVSQNYSKKSLDVYQQLKDLGWFDEKDPNIARNWAHALLYAGKTADAIPALQASLALQKDKAAQGDENDHLAAAFFAQGNLTKAQTYSATGLNLVQKNNGSKVWLTFGLMTKATILTKQNHLAESQATLKDALKIAEDNKLGVRQEEIKYLLSLPPAKVDVVQALMSR